MPPTTPFRLALLISLILSGCAAHHPPAQSAFRHNGITAHRGDHSNAPENTLPAFESAIDAGADWIELDVFTTKDGHVVVSHDSSTRRTGDRDLTIRDSTYDQLRHVDVAAAYRARTGQPFPPTHIPLLTGALALVKRHPSVRLSIQPKDDSTDRAVAVVQQMNMTHQVGFNDSSLPKMKRVKELDPSIKVHWDRPAKNLNLDADLATAKQRGFEALVLHHSTVTPDAIRRIKAAGLESGAWTVNDPATARQFLSWGLDRLYTDHPRLMLNLKRELAPKKPADAGN